MLNSYDHALFTNLQMILMKLYNDYKLIFYVHLNAKKCHSTSVHIPNALFFFLHLQVS